jgi:hypothetical protein
MTELRTRDIPVNWDVFVTPGIPTVTSDLPPGTRQQMWQPISSTLIYGKRDAILVDAFTPSSRQAPWWIGSRRAART